METTSDTGSATSAAAWPPEGWVLREDVARMFGIAPDTLKGWYRDGRIRFGKTVGRPGGGRCNLYPVAELERLMAEMDAARGKLPDGFVGREEAAAIFNLSASGWKKWRHMSRVPAGQWAKVPGLRVPIKVYPLDGLNRLRDELEAEGELRPDERTRATTKAERIAEDAARRPPAGWVGAADARHMFGVSKGVWTRWHHRGWVLGRKFGPNWYYESASLERLLADNGRMCPPYPDPQRPGVYRVPLQSWGMLRREVIVDAESLPLVEGRLLYLSPGEASRNVPGHVAFSDTEVPVALRRVIMGVTDPERYVVHANGDPLDCRRENLAVKTPAEHVQGNRKISQRRGEPCTSRFKGVSWERWTGSWVAQIAAEGRQRKIGRFKDEIAAAEAYDEAAGQWFGEHARLNFPNGVDAFLEAEAARIEGEAAETTLQPRIAA